MISQHNSSPYSVQGSDRSMLLNDGNGAIPSGNFRQRLRAASIVIQASQALARRESSTERELEHLQYSRIELPCLTPETVSYTDQTEFITEMVKNKKLEELHSLGGVEGVAKLLNSNTENGIRGDEDDLRERRVKSNSSTTYVKLRSIGKELIQKFFPFVLESLKDIIFSLLLICNIISMVLYIIEYSSQDGDTSSTIVVWMLLMVIVSANIKFLKQMQFDKLLRINNEQVISVVRDGGRQKVTVSDTVVGDVVFLAVGDQVPADGLFIGGELLQVDESSMAEESGRTTRNIVGINSTDNPFLLSDSKVVGGKGTMLVTSKGTDTAWAGIVSSIITNPECKTPLLERLDELTSFMKKVGFPLALIVLVITLIRYFLGEHEEGIRMAISLLDTISTALVNVLVVVPGDLALAFVLALVHSVKHMRADRVIVRNILACETMGSTTAICTEMTGILTLNQMKVTKSWVGDGEIEEIAQDISRVTAQDLIELFYQGVAFNTTDMIYMSESESFVQYSGGSTEEAILLWAVQDLGMDTQKVKQDYTILHVESFSSQTKRSGVLIRRKTDNCNYVHWKGAAETVLAMCSSYYEPTGELKNMSEGKRSRFVNIIAGMASSSLQCVALAYKKLDHSKFLSNYDTVWDISDKDLTLLVIIGVKDPCRPGSREAIRSCKFAGVGIKMITDENVFMAKAIATDCGILETNQEVAAVEVIEGNDFQNYTPEEQFDKVNNIHVMARASPVHKLLMVRCLKQKGHVVAVTGDKFDDAPALEEADLGLSMGSQGTQVAKASSDAEISDNSFSSIVSGLLWGRCLYSNIEKYIQFQLIVNIVVGLITIIGAVSSHDLPVTTLQYLWLDLIMEKLGALALAAESPKEGLMYKPPVDQREPLITNIMWRNILAQAVYQTAVLLTLQFYGMSLFTVEEEVRDTLIFNTVVMLQVFSLLNSRELERMNVFEGIHKNRMFLVIVVIVILIQVAMVEVFGTVADTVQLSLAQWGISIAIAAMTLPIGWIVKFVPVPKKSFRLSLPCIRAPPDDLILAAEELTIATEGHNLVSAGEASRAGAESSQT